MYTNTNKGYKLQQYCNSYIIYKLNYMIYNVINHTYKLN